MTKVFWGSGFLRLARGCSVDQPFPERGGFRTLGLKEAASVHTLHGRRKLIHDRIFEIDVDSIIGLP